MDIEFGQSQDDYLGRSRQSPGMLPITQNINLGSRGAAL